MPSELAKLVDVDVTAAWAHEAQNFTPWLSDNLDRLSVALNLPLEFVDREVGTDIVDRTEELERFEVEDDSFCAEGASRTLGLGWLSTYTNVCCLSWPEPRERRLGDELLSFVLVLPGIAGPLEECIELICSSR